MSQKLVNESFPELPFYIVTSLFFLDIGVLFGALNSLRVANLFNVPEIHLTHWTSTLFGAMTVIMLGQLFFIFTSISEKKHKYHKAMRAVLVLILTALGFSYLNAWQIDIGLSNNRMFVYLIKLAVLIYLALVGSLFLDNNFRENLKQTTSSWHLISAVIWLAISLIGFLEVGTNLNPRFMTTYIYGFFALTLFGSLSYVLPIMYDEKERSRGSMIREVVMLDTAALFFLLDVILPDDTLQVIDILAPVIWGIAGFLFLLWIFNLLYRTGMSNSLIGLIVAFLMFGFFVFDTFMGAVFPMWVAKHHVHFMFVGTLILTIISIGSRLIVSEISHVNKEVFNTPLGMTALGLTVASVGGILLSFTLILFGVAAIFGFILFGSLLFVEFITIRAIRREAS